MDGCFGNSRAKRVETYCAMESGDSLTLEPRDSLRQRVYLAPLGKWLALDCG